MSSCIVLIEDLKTGAPGVSEGGFNFMSGLDCGPCIGGLGEGTGPPVGLSADKAGAGLTFSFMGRLGGIGPPRLGEAGPPDDGVTCGPAGGNLICGLIGLDELGASEGLVGSAIKD